MVHSFMLAVATSGDAVRAGTRASSGVALVIAFVLVVTLSGLAIGLVARGASHDQEDDPGDSGSGGGGGPRRPTPPPRPGDDPVWWPEFERQFVMYVRSQSQEASTMTAAGSRVFPTPARP